jgi:hypothetical protein
MTRTERVVRDLFHLLDKRLDTIESMITSLGVFVREYITLASPSLVNRNEELLFRSLPKHLQESLFAVRDLGECTALEVSGHTGKVRAVESAYLSELSSRGFLKKRREGDFVKYSLLEKNDA